MASKEHVLELKGEDSVLRVQVASDIHLEMFSSDHQIHRRIPGHKLFKNSQFVSPIIEAKAPVLALLGDIGCPATRFAWYQDFLFEMAARFEHVLVLAGNHEYYVSHWKGGTQPQSVPEIKAVIAQVCAQRPNLHFLDNNSVTIRGVRILGTTLWSHVPPLAEFQVARSLNDYQMINLPGESWVNVQGTHVKQTIRSCRVHDTNQWHAEAVQWIQAELKALPKGHKCLVLTHHAPSFEKTSSPYHKDSPIGNAFATDLDYLLGSGKIHAWAFGHTHYNTNYINQGVRVVANQFGYMGDEEVFAYSPACVIEIPCPAPGLPGAEETAGVGDQFSALEERGGVEEEEEGDGAREEEEGGEEGDEVEGDEEEDEEENEEDDGEEQEDDNHDEDDDEEEEEEEEDEEEEDDDEEDDDEEDAEPSETGGSHSEEQEAATRTH